MGAAESTPSVPQNSSRKRRWSKDYPLSFALKWSKDYELYQALIEFLKFYEDKKDDLHQAISELQTILQQIEELENKTKTGKIAGGATLAAGAALPLISAPLTGGASLVALGVGAAAGVAGTATQIGVDSTHRSGTNQAKEKRKAAEEKFRSAVEQLEMSLNNVKRICAEMRQTEADVHHRELLLTLENQILTLQVFFLQQQCDNSDISKAIVSMYGTSSEFNKLINVFEDALKRLDSKYTVQKKL